MNAIMRTSEQMRYEEDTCPDKGKHTPSPDDYVAWAEWAEAKDKTHDQSQCPTCGLWTIWKRRKGPS